MMPTFITTKGGMGAKLMATVTVKGGIQQRGAAILCREALPQKLEGVGDKIRC
jgi:hypothetical protein